MDISAELAADLAALTQALNNPDIDLEAELRTFAADVKHAVASYCGMTMSIALDGHDVSFSVHDDARSKPATSLLIPLGLLTETAAAGMLLLHAVTPGAFVDLAADLSYALGIDPLHLVLDGHLDPPGDSTGMTGLHDHFAIDQAVGILIDRGHTPETAREELRRLAAADHGDLRTAANTLIRNTSATPPDAT